MANPNTALNYVRKLALHEAKTFQLGDPAMGVYVDDMKFAGYRVKVTRRYNGKNMRTKVKSYVNVVYTYEKAKK